MDWSGYEFTRDWFSNHLPVWEQLLTQLQPSRLVEVGSFEGRSACYLIANCANQRPMTLWCVDPWNPRASDNVVGDTERRFDRNIALATSRASHPIDVHKSKSPSSVGLAAIMSAEGPGTMDLIYIDGSHTAPDVLSDAIMSFHLLRVGGVMIFDDYLWHEGPAKERDILDMPKPAIDAFLNVFARKMSIVPHAPIYQLYAEKLAN